jgi:RNA polymerase sigma-70 factor (ECF subfamily)
MADLSTTLQLQRLLDRLCAGDPAAKDELINRAHGRLLLITRKVLGSYVRVRVEEETAGVLNEAYLRLHAALDEVKPGTVREFLGLAALQVRRVLLDTIRKIQGRGGDPRPRKVSLEDEGIDVPGPPSIGEGSVALDLLEAIEKLPDEEREAVDLLFFHGWTQPEAAEDLGVHEDTVKRRWARARVKLASHLDAFDSPS